MTEQSTSYETTAVTHTIAASVHTADVHASPSRKRSPTRWLMIINFITLLTCLVFLYDGYEPGWSLFTCMSIAMFAALAVAWAIGSFQWLTDSERDGFSLFGILRMAATPLLCVTCATLVIISIPTRIGLWASKDEFQPLIDHAPVVAGGEELNRRVGVYDVLRYAGDGDGGVYFMTGRYRDVLTRNATSLGLAYRPSRSGSPFGHDQYRLTHIAGDWYSFAATSDSRE